MALDPTEYFASKINSLNPADKMAELAAASEAKIAQLKIMKVAAQQQEAQRIASEAAAEKSWVGKLGVDPNSIPGTAVNLGASLVSGGSRMLGQVANLPINAFASLEEGQATPEQLAAFNRYQMVGELTNPADMAILNQKAGTSPYLESAEGKAWLAANPGKGGPTVLDTFKSGQKAREVAGKVQQFFDLTGTVHQGNRDVLAKELGKDFSSAWNEVKEGWNDSKDGKIVNGSGNIIAGLTRLVYNAGEAALTNPTASAEYVAENAPQLAVGALGKAGGFALGTSNIAYATDTYREGIKAYQDANGQALPDAATKREMALYAASLALAEHVGDLSLLKGMKAAGGVDEVAEVGFTQGMKNVAKEGLKGAVTEGLTEGYQTFAEEKIKQKDATALEIYTGATIGAISGGHMSGGMRALAELAKATPEHQQSEQEKISDAIQFRTAAEANDPSIYLDEKAKTYDPAKAIGVLLRHAQSPEVATEVKEANLKQAGEIMASMEEKKDKLTEKVEYHSPEAIKQVKDQIEAIKEQMTAATPDKAVVMQETIDLLQEDLAERLDSKQALPAKTALSKLERSMKYGTELISALTETANVPVTEEEVASLVSEVSDEGTAQRVINLSMTQPDALSAEQALALSTDTTNSLTTEQRAHLRAFSDARLAENELSDISKVSDEVLFGSDKNVGISQYKARIASALASNNATTANRQLALLEKFAKDHADKISVAAKAMSKGLGTQIRKTLTQGWEIVPDDQKMSKEALKRNGGLSMDSGRLLEIMKAEAVALRATTKEMKSAINLKFGVAESSGAAVQSNPTAKTTTSESPASLFREKREREGRVEEGEPSSPKNSVSSSTRESKPKSAAQEKADKKHARQEQLIKEANEKAAERKAAKAAQEQKQEQVEVTEQPASVSEAPVAEVTTPVTYKQQNLIKDFFTREQGTDGTARPLVSVPDFLSTLKNDPAAVEQFLQDKPNEQQKAVINAFVKTATAWDSKIKDSLVRINNKDYRFNDLAQFFITEEGDVDMEQNVKTAIAYAAWDGIIGLYASGTFNDAKAINGILGRNEETEVTNEEYELLADVGTLEKVLKNGWGQTVVSALGLKPSLNAPQNLLPALEAAMGAHVFKLLMEVGVIERKEVPRSELNLYSSAKKQGEATTKDEFIKIQFVKLVRDANKQAHPLAQKIFDVNKGTQSVLSKLFGTESFFKEPSLKPVKFTQKSAGDGRMAVPKTLAKIVNDQNKAAHRVNQELFNYVLGQVSPEIALEMAGLEDESVQHASRRRGTQAKNEGLEREYNRLMEFVGATLKNDLDQDIFFEHDVWVQQRVGIKTNMVNPQTSKLQRHMLYRPSWETKVSINNIDAMDNFRLRVAEGLGVKTDKKDKEAALEEVKAKLQDPTIKGAINVLRKARSMSGLTENEQSILAAGVKAGGENFHSLSVLMAVANYADAVATGQTEFTTQLMAEVDGVTNGPMLSHLLMGAANSVDQLFNLLNRGGFYQAGNTSSQYNVWRSVAGHMDLYENTTNNMLTNLRSLIRQGEVDQTELGGVEFFTGALSNNKGVTKDGRNVIKTPLTAMVFGSSIPSAVDSMADTFVDSVYKKIEALRTAPENKAEVISNLKKLGVYWPSSMTVEQMMEQSFTEKEVKSLKWSLKNTLGKAVDTTMKQDFEQFLTQRNEFNKTAQLTFEIYNAAYKAERNKLISELIASGDLAVNGKGDPIQDLTKAQEKQVRDRVKALEPIIHSAMSKDSNQLEAGLFMGKTERTLSKQSAYQNEVHFATEIKGTGAKSSNVGAYETNQVNPGVAMMPLVTHSFDSMVSHYAAKQGDVLNIHDAHGAGLDQIKKSAENLNKAVWDAALNFSPAQEMHDAFMRTVRGLDEVYKDGIPQEVLENLASVISTMSDVPQSALSVQANVSKTMAYRADDIKLAAMEKMEHIDQYAMEGGHYEVTDANRIAARSLRSTLASSLASSDQAILDKIEGQLKAVLEKTEGEVKAQPAPVANVAELGKSVIVSDPALVKAFENSPTMGVKQAVALLKASAKDGFQQKLLTALEKVTDPDLTIRYVTKDTAPGDLLAQGGDKSRGWYVSKDSNHAIYVLSPEFKHSGLTAELLIHELTHAALARTIEQAKADGKGSAYNLVQDLESLRTQAAEFVKANKLEGVFGPAVANVHELVSWGMSNADFQNQVLMKMPYTTNSKDNSLINAMKGFIDTLVSLLFGKNPALNTGMEALIVNSAGLFQQAARNKNQAQSSSIVLNQTNTGVRNLSTVDIYDALEQNNNGAVVSAEFGTHLKNLLTGFVSKLYGPAGSFREAIMHNTITDPATVFAEAMVTGIAPLAFNGLSSGFAFTHQEAFVAEQVYATMREAMTNPSGVTSVAYRELAKLYAEVRARMTPADFASQELYDFIFDVKQGPDGRSDYLARFAAMGMAHESFNKMLKVASNRTTHAVGPMSFNDRLNKIFEQVLNWFTGKMTNTIDGQDIDVQLKSLMTQLVRIEERKRAVVAAKAKVLSPIEATVDGLGQAVRTRIANFSKLPFFKNSSSGIVRLAGNLTSAVATDRVENILEQVNAFRDQHFQGKQHGMAAAMVNEFRGSNASNVMFHFLLRATKYLEGKRKDLITYTGKVITSSFANDGQDLTKEHKEALSAVFLRADVAALMDTYSMDQIKGLIDSPAYVLKEIKKAEASLEALSTKKFNRYFINASKVLAYYKVTGKVTDAHMVMNAGNIARLYGTNYRNRVTETEAVAAEKIIDSLVTLYALSYSDSTHIKLAQEVLSKEAARTDSGNGVEVMLRTHKALQAQSKELLFGDSAALQMKGYTTEIFDPYMKVVAADETEGAALLAQGYTRVDAPLPADKADNVTVNSKVKTHLYHLRDGGLKQHLTGVFSYTGLSAKGTRIHNGNLSPMSYQGQMNGQRLDNMKNNKAKDIQAMFVKKDFDPAAVNDTFMAPVLNANGDVVNYRYMMTEKVKDTLLMRDNRPEKLLGMMAGATFDKVSSKEQNRKAVHALHLQYKEEFAERPESYLTVGPKSSDPQLREIWAMLPESTKQAVREIWGSEQMKVRVDLLDINFGYRKLSIADAFEKDAAERNFVESMFVDIMRNMFDEKAGLRVRQAEDIWQAVVKMTKANLVVRSISTMTGNLRSNWSQLLLMGVSPTKILEHHRVALKGAWAYKKDSEEVFALQHQVDTNYLLPGQTIADLKHQIARLEDGMARNPVKPLIDAGLMPTIVEDIQPDDDVYSYKSRFAKFTERAVKKVNPHIVDAGKELLMMEGTNTFQFMSYATQISDFLARYTLYTAKTEAGMSKDEAIQLASDAFINYDVPTHRMIQYANDSGLVMFTKYYMRIQKMLAKIYKDNPGRVMALIAAEHMIGDQPTVLDSSMITRWGNPLNLGALDYPGSLDQLTTVRILTSPFRGGGNPAE